MEHKPEVPSGAVGGELDSLAIFPFDGALHNWLSQRHIDWANCAKPLIPTPCLYLVDFTPDVTGRH